MGDYVADKHLVYLYYIQNIIYYFYIIYLLLLIGAAKFSYNIMFLPAEDMYMV